MARNSIRRQKDSRFYLLNVLSCFFTRPLYITRESIVVLCMNLFLQIYFKVFSLFLRDKDVYFLYLFYRFLPILILFQDMTPHIDIKIYIIFKIQLLI